MCVLACMVGVFNNIIISARYYYYYYLLLRSADRGRDPGSYQ